MAVVFFCKTEAVRVFAVLAQSGNGARNKVMACLVMAYVVMAYIVVVYIVMAYVVMAYVVMAYV